MLRKRWTTQENDIIISKYSNNIVSNVIKLFPNRTRGAVRAQARRLGVSSGFYWTNEEKDYLRKYYPTNISKEELCNNLKRSWPNIKARANQIGLNRPHQKGRLPNKRLGNNAIRAKWRKYYTKILPKKCVYPNCQWNQTLEIHHKNGNSQDWREENLEMLCPNHHSITSTHAHQGHNGWS